MIKRMLLAALVAAAIVAPTTGAPAAQLTVYKAISGLYQNGPVTVGMFGQLQQDLVGNTQSAYGQVYVQTSNGTDSGSGTLDVVLDPTGTLGRLSGTIQGNSGPITVDAVFISLGFTSIPPPYVAVYKEPGQPKVFGTFSWTRLLGEFATASVTSGVGNVDASGAPAQSYPAVIVEAL